MSQQEDDDQPNDRYGVVIDAGSSGSRMYIYKWQDPGYTATEEGPDKDFKLKSVPQVSLLPNGIVKALSGLSSFEDKPEQAFKKHIEPLLHRAEERIPASKLKMTPIFIQSTAGMRLLPKKKREKIILSLCTEISQKTDFLLSNCEMQIQTIDGETEGLYGWIALNYLKGAFNSYDESADFHDSHGFMDMGGASNQIAFKPSDYQGTNIQPADVSTIILKNVNGNIQEWKVFSGTWLNFGTNEAKRRYYTQLANSVLDSVKCEDCDDDEEKKVYDPCLLRGSTVSWKHHDQKFQLVGSGNYEECKKLLYPLLLKNLPCTEEPCLFNAVHTPPIDFTKDKFLGVSEYWYSTNDVFKSGGEYNFSTFSSKVKEFCESDWSDIIENNNNAMYNGISQDNLRDACFKATWIINVLHEGIGFPTIDNDSDSDTANEDGTSHYLKFQTADKVDEKELSWTLGRVLLYASSMVTFGAESKMVGLTLSSKPRADLEHNSIPGHIIYKHKDQHSSLDIIRAFYHIFLLMIFCVLLHFAYTRLHLSKYVNANTFRNLANMAKNKLKKINYRSVPFSEDLGELEEGIFTKPRFNMDRDGVQFRSRTSLNQVFFAEEDQNRNKFGRISPALSNGNLRTVFSMADFSKFDQPRS